MTLSETEKAGCTNLLQGLPSNELFSLAETVTKKQVGFGRSKTGKLRVHTVHGILES